MRNGTMQVSMRIINADKFRGLDKYKQSIKWKVEAMLPCASIKPDDSASETPRMCIAD
jgi:hypothetical protein